MRSVDLPHRPHNTIEYGRVIEDRKRNLVDEFGHGSSSRHTCPSDLVKEDALTNND